MLDARLVRVILGASGHLLSPRHYEQFLKQAGLERFRDPPSDPENELGISKAEMARFMHAIVDKIGVEATRLFFANVADEMSRVIIKHPYTNALKKELAGLAVNERREKALEGFLGWANSRGSEFELTRSENSGSWLVTVKDCPYCTGICSDKPICDIITVNLRIVLAYLFDSPVQVSEVQCRAKGDPECVCEIGEVWD